MTNPNQHDIHYLYRNLDYGVMRPAGNRLIAKIKKFWRNLKAKQ